MNMHVKRFSKPAKKRGGKGDPNDGPKPLYAPCFFCGDELQGDVVRVTSGEDGTRLYDPKCYERTRRR